MEISPPDDCPHRSLTLRKKTETFYWLVYETDGELFHHIQGLKFVCASLPRAAAPPMHSPNCQVLAELVMLQKGSRVYMGHDMAECTA